MKFHNTHPTSALNWSFGREKFSVEVGGEVDVPDHWVPWVKSRGLMLAEGPAKVAVAEPEPTKASEPDPVPVPEVAPRQKK